MAAIAFVEVPLFQVFILYAIQTFWVMFQGYYKPMQWKWQNKIVQFNESMLSLSVICLPLMTDIILDPYGKYVTGFFPTIIMIVTVLNGGISVILNLLKWIILILR